MTTGLRERKKEALRRHISDVATRRFAERGFDAVSVEQIADEVGVSKVTVFNYFPRKEDLVFDRQDELLARVTAAARPGEHPIGTTAALLVGFAEGGHPLLAAVPHADSFGRMVAASPALRARAAELAGALEDCIADLLRARGLAADRADTAAGMLVAAWRAAWKRGVRGVDAGEALSAIREGQADLLRHAAACIVAAYPVP